MKNSISAILAVVARVLIFYFIIVGVPIGGYFPPVDSYYSEKIYIQFQQKENTSRAWFFPLLIEIIFNITLSFLYYYVFYRLPHTKFIC